jgi:FAD/FMN-containing dehydrogenase
MTDYQDRVARLQAQLAALPAGAPVRLGKKTSNLFRQRAAAGSGPTQRLDVSEFSGVLSVDTEAQTADVLGMTTYEDLVAATLPHGLMPTVVPQLKTITLGGAVTGMGIESSSFRNGGPHEGVLEVDVLTGDGRVVTASRSEHADLFHGFPNSYGTLGYSLRLKIELEPVKPYVHLRHVRVDGTAGAAELFDHLSSTRTHEGESVDFLDGTWFSEDEVYVTVGSWADDAPTLSDYTGNHIYYRSIQTKQQDWLTVHDYLWRWDTDWFWCSRALGVQNPAVRRWIPKRYLRSDTWWKVVNFERRHGWKQRWDIRRGGRPQEHVVQDIEVPVTRLAEYMEFFAREIPVQPVWFCPMRGRGEHWDLYPMDPATLFVNVGFWSSVGLEPGEADGTHNRRIEQVVSELGGHKSLYSTSFYEPDEFWRLYGGDGAYDVLKKTYDPDGRLLDLYSKCVGNR